MSEPKPKFQDLIRAKVDERNQQVAREDLPIQKPTGAGKPKNSKQFNVLYTPELESRLRKVVLALNEKEGKNNRINSYVVRAIERWVEDQERDLGWLK